MADCATEAVLEAARAGGAATIAAPLHEYPMSIPGNARRALTRGDRGWAIADARNGELRRAGNRWVAIEVPSEGPPGIFLSVFIDEVAPERR